MSLTIVLNGQPIPTAEFQIDGRETGFGEVLAVMAALGVPVRQTPNGTYVGIRKLVDLAKLSGRYDSTTETFYAGANPLPELPAEPVGANVQPSLPVTAPICSGQGDRRPELLERVIRQFQVARNARLVPRQGNTYCNIYVWDVTRALGAEVPHWVDGQGRPSKPGAAGAWEMDANAVCGWLARCGADYGWKPVSAELALMEANAGRPAVAAWFSEGGIGHVAVVRPGKMSDRGVPIAQAGARNFDDGYLADGFGAARVGAVKYYVHD